MAAYTGIFTYWNTRKDKTYILGQVQGIFYSFKNFGFCILQPVQLNPRIQ